MASLALYSESNQFVEGIEYVLNTVTGICYVIYIIVIPISI